MHVPSGLSSFNQQNMPQSVKHLYHWSLLPCLKQDLARLIKVKRPQTHSRISWLNPLAFHAAEWGWWDDWQSFFNFKTEHIQVTEDTPNPKMNPNHCTLPHSLNISERVTWVTFLTVGNLGVWIQPHSSLRGSSWTFRDGQVIVTLEHCPLCSKTEILGLLQNSGTSTPKNDHKGCLQMIHT